MLNWLDERERELARVGSEIGDAGKRIVSEAKKVSQEALDRLSGQGGSRVRDSQGQTSLRQKRRLDEQILENARRLEAQARASAVAVARRAQSSPGVRRAAARTGLVTGNLAGLTTGVLQSAEDLKDGAVLGARLADPTETWRVPRGEAAWDEVAASVDQLVDRGERFLANPRTVTAEFVSRKRRELDPSATRPAPSASGEMHRNFAIGRKQGEAFVNGAGWVLGPAGLKAASGVSRLTKAQRIAKHLDEGLSEAKAAHLAEPYAGKGHHAIIPERARLPQALGGGPYPRWVLDSPFNRLHPTGILRGEFYELHSRVDPYFQGAGFPRRMGPGGWSAKRAGIEKYGPLGRAYYGTPGPTKAVVGGAALAGGGYLNEAMEEPGWR